MTEVPSVCEECGKGGLIYGHEGHFYCPACLAKKRPPLSYRGPERRRGRGNIVGFVRRDNDRNKKK